MNVWVTTGGRVVIPAAVRRQLGIKPGTKLRVEWDDTTHQLILTPITPEFIDSLYGKYKGLHLLERLIEDRRQDSEREG